jgi:hypothetical protein
MKRRGFLGAIAALFSAPPVAAVEALLPAALGMGAVQVYETAIREDLSDMIWDLYPMDSYFSAASPRQMDLWPVRHEWSIS